MKGALCVGLGAALADSFYGFVAALGFTNLQHKMITGSSTLKCIGGMFLLYLAYKEIKSTKVVHAAHVSRASLLKMITEVFFLTITNPMTILSFMGIFASIGIESSSNLGPVTVVAGIFIGSMTWWFALGIVITKIKHKLPEIWLQRIKWISCFTLASFGLAAIFSALM